MWDVQASDRQAWLRDFAAMARHPRHIVTASSAYMAKELEWQTGSRPPTLRLLGLHTGAAYAPVRAEKVLVSRFGTSAALSECVMARFLDANPWYPLQFVQLESVLFEQHQVRVGHEDPEYLLGAKVWKEYKHELKTPGMPYDVLAEHRAAVLFPYDAIIFLFHELYSMRVPVFVPRELWRWLFGPLTHPSMEERLEDDANASRTDRPPYTPFGMVPRRSIDVEQAAYWAAFSDWALLPHVQYFSSAPELMMRALDFAALRKASAQMKTFNEEQLVLVANGWKHLAHRLAYVAASGRASSV